VCTRGASRTLLGGRSTSPLEVAFGSCATALGYVSTPQSHRDVWAPRLPHDCDVRYRSSLVLRRRFADILRGPCSLLVCLVGLGGIPRCPISLSPLRRSVSGESRPLATPLRQMRAWTVCEPLTIVGGDLASGVVMRPLKFTVRCHVEVLDRQDCESNLQRISQLLACGIFSPVQRSNLLQQSAFIDLVICLRDFLAKSEKYGHRVAFSDDVMLNEYVKDVTDAVTAIRDACCHIDSFKRHFDDHMNRGSYLVAFGRANLVKFGDLELKSDYADDIAFFYGANRLYLKRHIMRAFEEAKSHLVPLLSLQNTYGT
jgi:hypothetical protein